MTKARVIEIKPISNGWLVEMEFFNAKPFPYTKLIYRRTMQEVLVMLQMEGVENA